MTCVTELQIIMLDNRLGQVVCECLNKCMFKYLKFQGTSISLETLYSYCFMVCTCVILVLVDASVCALR